MTNSRVILESKFYLGTAGSLYSIKNLCCTLLLILLIYLLNIFCYITQVLKAVPKTTKNKSTSKKKNNNVTFSMFTNKYNNIKARGWNCASKENGLFGFNEMIGESEVHGLIWY